MTRYYFPWKNPSIRDDLRSIKLTLKLVYHKWAKSLLRMPDVPLHDRLHIGCGPLVRDGWVNLDLFPADGAHYVDGNNALPFEDSIFQHIHCEHFLEHLEQERAIRFLKNCFRVLKPGGSFRIIVPDAEKYFRAYVAGDTEYFQRLENLGGSSEALRTPCEVVNRMFRMWGAHRFAWDFETLSLYMKEAGFEKILVSRLNDVAEEYDIDGEDWWREVESLYVNSIKPRT